MPSAASGIIWFDIVMRPFFKFAVKFPIFGLACLLIVYGTVGYYALKSAYLDMEY
jgi:hypothetical protein